MPAQVASRAIGLGGVLAALALAAALLGVAAVGPDAAHAHGIVGREDLPIPRWLFGWGATAVLVLSFIALAVLWPRPRLERSPERAVLTVPRAAEPVCGAIGVALFALVVYAGLAGTQEPADNLAPTAIYVLFWVGVPVLSLFLGDVFRAFNPWRAMGRAAERVLGDRLPAARPYPQRLGRWPAVAGLLAFAWVELAFARSDDPSVLATLALVYAAVQLVGMALYGVETWSRNGDAFGTWFRLCSSLAALHWHDGRLHVRRPLSGVTQLRRLPGTVALLAVAIGSTTFDGLSGSEAWRDVVVAVQDALAPALGATRAAEAAATLGLLGIIALAVGLYWLGVAGMRTIDPRSASTDLGGRFAHSLVPIALAYVVAHYFSLLAYEGQAAASLASDPLGEGWNLLGTASATVDYGVVSANVVWYVQVGALVVGHVAGLVLAHDRALLVFRGARDATRSQYWMLAVMVAFTSLGLWLLSAG